MTRIPAKLELQRDDWLVLSINTWKLHVPMHEYALGFYIFQFTAQTNDMHREIGWLLGKNAERGGRTWSK